MSKVTLAEYILEGLQQQNSNIFDAHAMYGSETTHVDGDLNLEELSEWIETYVECMRKDVIRQMIVHIKSANPFSNDPYIGDNTFLEGERHAWNVDIGKCIDTIEECYSLGGYSKRTANE